MNVSKGGKELTNWTIKPLGVGLGRVPVNYPILGPSMCIIFIMARTIPITMEGLTIWQNRTQ